MRKAFFIAFTFAILMGLACGAAYAYPQIAVSTVKWAQATAPSGDIPNFTARLYVSVRNNGDQTGSVGQIKATVNVYRINKYGTKTMLVANKIVPLFNYGVQMLPGATQNWYTDVPMPYYSDSKYSADVSFTSYTPTVSTLQ